MYFFNRKGWSLSNEELEKEGVIDSIGRLGATHFIVDKTNYTDFVFRGEQLHVDDYFAIYFLTKDN